MRMPRVCSISVSLLAFILCSFSVSFPATEEKSPWLEIRSTHFTVVTDAGDKKGREVAVRFEQMRAIFATLLMKNRLNDSEPLTILAFKNDKDYYQSAPLRKNPLGKGPLSLNKDKDAPDEDKNKNPAALQPIGVPGFFVPAEDQNFIVLNLFEEESWRAVAHDFAHMVLNFNYPPVEGWFDEGLAEYFSSIRVDNKQYQIGGDPELSNLFSTDLLDSQTEARNPPKSLTEILGAEVWLALPDLLTIKHDTSAYNEGTHHTLFYAQSWITVHYLLHEKKLPETGTYFDLVENQHVPVADALQKAYGMTPEQFDKAVKDYFHSLTPLFTALDASKQANPPPNPAQVYQLPVPVGPNDSVITAKTITVLDARATVDEMKIRIPERRDAALKDLEALAIPPASATAATNPPRKEKKQKEDKDDEATPLAAAGGNEIAHRALAWDHLQRGEFDATTEELSDAAILNPRDMWVRYYLSLLKYRVSKTRHYDIQGLPNMMQDLRGVLEWYPEFADAYDLLAMARLVGGGSIAAMQSERAAINLSPRNQEYIYHLAEIYVGDKKWIAARELLDRLKTSSNPQVAAEAKDQLGRLASEQKYGLSANLSNAPKLSSQPSPFDVLEQDAAKRAADEKAKQSTTADKRSAKFMEGRLVAVDCSQPPAAVLTVASGEAVLKFRTPDFKSLLVIGAATFSCQWSDRRVSVNYKPGGISDGDLVSVEVR
jgi:tetratricopeptide (TPR) repeat protein